MRIVRLSLFAAIVIALMVGTSSGSANHGTSVGTSWCKWDFPWTTGQAVKFWVSANMAWPQFPNGNADAINRVTYGSGTWNGWGFNLQFERASTTAQAQNGYGLLSQHVVAVPANSGAIADTFIWPNTGCNRDQGRPIKQAVTSWNPNYRFYSDCRAAGATWCSSQGYYDIHNIAAHEFGHWFHLGHSPADSSHPTNSEATMYGTIFLGETKKRDLSSDDIYAGQLEYGRR